jgi:hypothetical protein
LKVSQGPLLPTRSRIVGTAGFFAELDQVLDLVEQQSWQTVKETREEIEVIRRQVQKLLQDLQEMRGQRDVDEEKTGCQERVMVERMQTTVTMVIEKRAEMEAKLGDLTELQVGALQDVFYATTGSRALYDITTEAGEELQQLRARLEAERRERQGRSEKLMADLDSDVRRSILDLQAQSRQRFEIEAEVMRSIEDIRAKIGELLRQEVGEREAVHEKLLSLLEDITIRTEHYAPPPQVVAFLETRQTTRVETQARGSLGVTTLTTRNTVDRRVSFSGASSSTAPAGSLCLPPQ